MSTLTPVDTFPHPELTAIPSDEKPTFINLKIIHQQLNANAMEIPSSRGGGQHGHLALVLSTAKYDAIPTTQPWVAPMHPGPAPVHGANPTAPQITEVNRAFKASLDEFMLFVATQAALKKQLLKAVPDTFTKTLKDDELGYAMSPSTTSSPIWTQHTALSPSTIWPTTSSNSTMNGVQVSRSKTCGTKSKTARSMQPPWIPYPMQQQSAQPSRT